MQRASVDLPQPVSPTRPSVSPRRPRDDPVDGVDTASSRPLTARSARTGKSLDDVARRAAATRASALTAGRQAALRGRCGCRRAAPAGSQQAERCPAASTTGRAAASRSGTGPTRTRQRGWNGQPAGRPDQARRRAPGSASAALGRAAPAAAPAIRPWVYGWCGAVVHVARSPPPPPRRRTSPSPRRRCSATHAEVVRDQDDRRAELAPAGRCISSMICAWTVTSSAVVGSSAISSFGLSASAIAIIARWRIPPENWCG